MKIRTRHILLVLGLVLASGGAGIAWLAYALLSDDSAWNQASALDRTLEWGRLAPLPRSAQRFPITTRGSMFTREFQASFVAPPGDLEAWLRYSPGTSEAVVTTPSPGVRHFQIEPGGGAGFAEVTVDETQNLVTIRVYWS